MKFIMSEKELFICNNLVWKFNRDLKYPVSLARTAASVLLRDKDQTLFFRGNPNLTLPDEKMHNLIQFTRINWDTKTEEENINLRNQMTFLGHILPDEKTVGVLTLYAFEYDDKTERCLHKNLKEFPNDIASCFSQIGTECMNAMELCVKVRRNQYIEKWNEDHHMDDQSFFARVKRGFHLWSNSRSVPDNPFYYLRTQLNPWDFEDSINLSSIIPPLMDKYIWDKNSMSREKNNCVRNLVIVFHIDYPKPFLMERASNRTDEERCEDVEHTIGWH